MKKNVGQLTNDVFSILNGYDKEDILKVLSSVSTLLEINNISNPASSTFKPPLNQQTQNPSSTNDAKSFFEIKKPKNKGEEFAVAAKFRIDNDLGEEHSKEDLKTVIKTQARLVFDEKNFNRDIQNAMRQAKFFMKGSKNGHYMLSAYGEKMVNALPNREEIEQLKKSKTGKATKKAKAKK